MSTEAGILLDNTNGELEILEFVVNDCHFGVNVSKISEIVMDKEVVPMPTSHCGIRGMFNIRDMIYTVYDLNKILYEKESPITKDTYFILCNFNNLNTAFIVDSVLGIRRSAWADIIKPSSALSSGEKCSITGIIRQENKLISLLDFEALVSSINPEMGLQTTNKEIPKDKLQQRGAKTILIADDSKLLNKMICETVSKEGYQIYSVEDGKQLIDAYEKNPSGYAMIITDIEMPVMDGLEASKILKERYPKLPIIVFSSLVNDALQRKVQNLGLDGMITKPQLPKLIELCDQLIFGQ